jgi:hypothetical protein
MHAFVTLCIIYLENIDASSYVDFPNVDIFHYKISKYHIHEYHHQIHQKKSLKY